VQDQVYVVLRAKQIDGTWRILLFTELDDTVMLASANASLLLRDLYDTLFDTI
jgi:hypothetical protein